MMIEEKVIAWLNTKLPEGWAASGDVPDEKPEKFVVVERTGGDVGSVRIESPELIIGYFHKTSAAEAGEVALEMDKLLRLELTKEKNISRVDRMSLVRLDDLVIKYPRYQGYYSLVHLL